MRALSFRMPACNGRAFDTEMRVLQQTPQPASGGRRVVNFVTGPRGDFARLDITYFMGEQLNFRYEAFMSLEEFKNPSIEFPYYHFISAQYLGQRDDDFGCGDVGPFYQLHHNPLFYRLNPNWVKKFRNLVDLELVLLNEDIRTPMAL